MFYNIKKIRKYKELHFILGGRGSKRSMNVPKIQYRHLNTKVFNYLFLNKRELKLFAKEIEFYRIRNNLPHNRSVKSYYKELLAHKRLYKLHLFRSHTIDCDLEEHIKKWKEIFYYIIGI